MKPLCIEQVDRDDPDCYYDSGDECGNDLISMEPPIDPVVRIRNQHALQCIGLENLYTHLSGQQGRGIPRTDVLTRAPFTARQLEYISAAHRDNIPEGERKDMVWLAEQKQEENEEFEEMEEFEEDEDEGMVPFLVRIPDDAVPFFTDNIWSWDGNKPEFLTRELFDHHPRRLRHPRPSDGNITNRLSQIKNQFQIVAWNVEREDVDAVMARFAVDDRERVFLLLDFLLKKAIASIPVTRARVDFVGRIPRHAQVDAGDILQWVRESFPFVHEEFYRQQPFEFWARHHAYTFFFQHHVSNDHAHLFMNLYKNLYWYLYEEQGRPDGAPQGIFPRQLDYLNE